MTETQGLLNLCINKGYLNDNEDKSTWTNEMFDQLKAQLIAYKYLLRNQSIPEEIINEISQYEISDWKRKREYQLKRNQENFENKFKDSELTMKELAPYFKKKIKENDIYHQEVSAEKNYINEVEYTYEHELDAKRQRLKYIIDLYDKNKPLNSYNDYELELTEEQQLYLNSKSKISKEDRNLLETQLKFLNLYNLQSKVRRDVINNYIGDVEKQNLVYYTDMLFSKTLLDRKSYKRVNLDKSKRDMKVNERFEQQLRSGYDTRKKNKHRDYMNEVMNTYKEFSDFHRNKKYQLKKRSQMTKTYLDNKEKKDLQLKEKMDRERLKYLKENDIDKYIKSLKEAKDTRLLDFMGQTSLFLKEIENKVFIQKDYIKSLKVSQGKSSILVEDEEKDKEKEVVSEVVVQQKEGNEEEPTYYDKAHTYNEDIIEQPSTLIGGSLKSYQILGLKWMVSLYNNNLNGILADEMGLGKTIQTISLLTYIVEKKKNNGPFLIVAPLSTISNWIHEFDKWSPYLKVIVYKGSPAERKSLAYQMRNEKDSFNVLITTYEYIMKDKLSLNKVIWQYIIVDEGHRMKNSKSKFTQTLGTQFNSVCRLLLTGTPLQNNLSELWALLNFILPKIFNSCEDFEKWFNQPFSNKLGGNSADRQNFDLNEEEQLLIINRLHQVLRPFLLRREKTQVEKELPSKVEHVIKIELSAWQKIVYKQISKNGLLARDPSTGKIGSRALINAMMQLRKICNHPYLFLEKDNPLYYNSTDIIYKSSGKFELLDRIIPKLIRYNHKILIFSQMTQLMDILDMYLNYRGWIHLRLDGNTKSEDRCEQMRLFNEPDSPFFIFVLSTRAGGLGLNLQAADTVIIFDSDWNPQMDLQAQDRAHRIGQRNEVRVLRLITNTKIETDILNKAAFKKNLDEKIIKAGGYNTNINETERKKKLEDLLKQDKEDNEDKSEIPSDEQINNMIARSEEEYQSFQLMDKERYELERREEKINNILKLREREEKERLASKISSQNLINIVNKTRNKKEKDDENSYFSKNDDENEASDSEIEERFNINYRLMNEDEVPEWVNMKSNTNEDVIEYGKGMRIRPKVDYRDDFNSKMYENIFESQEEEEEENEEKSFLEKKRRKKNEEEDESKEFDISIVDLNKKGIKRKEGKRKEKLELDEE